MEYIHACTAKSGVGRTLIIRISPSLHTRVNTLWIGPEMGPAFYICTRDNDADSMQI